jgi:NADH dehydrogenase [ubiquinone] 1 alpha subcomplex assembly factor 7
MVGVWCLVTWMNLGRPSKLRLVELGPGRGTLMSDLLRGAGSFPEFAQALEVELVEISPALRRAQWVALRCTGGEQRSGVGSGGGETGVGEGGGGGQDAVEGTSSVSGGGVRVRWRATLDEVPQEGPPTVYLAHEFFDALPVHQFVRDKGGRCKGTGPAASCWRRGGASAVRASVCWRPATQACIIEPAVAVLRLA